MRHALRRHEQIARIHLELAAVEEKKAFALQHVIDLVLVRVCMERVFLPRLEGVEADEQAQDSKIVALPIFCGE